MASKFSEFIEKNKIDLRRVHAASRQIERLRFEDRVLKMAQRGKRAEGKPAKGAEAAPAAPKPRSGRVVTGRLLTQVANGKPVSGAAKTRVLRAVNRVLEQKKKSPVALKELF